MLGAHEDDSGKKKKKRLVHVVFLDLANAFGSAPHSRLWEAQYLKVTDVFKELVREYFQDTGYVS